MINITTIRKRMTKGLLLMMLFLAQSVVSSAQVKLYMEDFTISSGEWKQVSLLLDNDQTATQMQVEIALPAGMSYDYGSAVKTSRVKGRGATVQASTNGQKLIIVETGGTIEPGSGEVITFTVHDNNLKVGDHTMTLSNIIISDPNGDQLNQEETNTVTVKKLGLEDCFFAGPESIDVTVGKEYQVDITLTNEGIYNLSGLQGKLALPAGLEIVPGEDGKFIYSYRTPAPLEFTFKEYEGYTSFVLSSSDNTLINGRSGVIFSFKVKADVSLAENTTILLSDLHVAATSGLSADVPNVEIKVVNTSVADKAAFEAYQADKVAEVEAMPLEGDSETTLTLIANAKSAIEALTFDYALTLAANKAAVDAIVNKLTADVTAQRDQEAREKAASEKLAALKTAAEALVISEEAKAYESETVQAKVADAETAIADANTAIAAVEAIITEGVTAENAEALAAAVATAEQAIADAKTAIAAAEKAYADQKAIDDAAEAGAKAAAEASVTSLKVLMEEIVLAEGAAEYEAENVKTAVAAALQAIADANAAIKAIEDLIEEGKLATDNKVAVAQAILAAQRAVDAADDAVEIANNIYAEQKAADEAAALAAAKADLQDAITAAKAAETEGMTEESVQALNDAIAAAEAALAAETATVESLTAALTALNAAVAGLTPKPIIAEGKYYIFNPAANGFIVGANNWGTRASISQTGGIEFEAVLANGKYELKSAPLYAGKHLGFNGYVDNGDLSNWTIAPVEGQEGVYTLTTDAGTVLFWDGGNATTTSVGAMPETAANAYWQFISPAERLAAFATATAEAPVDATFLISNPNFSREASSAAWTIVASNKNLCGGTNENKCAESFHSNFTLSQVLANAPKGVYGLTAQGFYRQDGEDNDHLPVFFANEETQTFPLKTGSENSMNDASNSFLKGLYVSNPVFVKVTEDGALTIGAKLEGNTSLWCIWDNFQMTYYGVDADIEALKNAAIIKELAELREKATELLGQVEVASIKTALEETLAATAEVSGTDAINAAIETLKAVIEKANVHIAAKPALAGMENVMAGTNVYTAEAFETYNGIYVAAKAKYDAGELTAEDKLENPESLMGWHAANIVDDLLLSAWTIGETQCKDYDAGMYINTWSVEGENDGSNFKVPFFEYWVADANSLAENTLTATMSNLPEGKYDVTAWVRVRAKNGYTAPAYGITLSANEGEAIDVAAGDQIGESQFFMKEFTATGEVAADGVLKIQFKVAADNNISWLSFKNVKFEKQIVVNPDDPEIAVPDGMVNLITNGNLAGDDVTSFVSKEYPSTDIVGARIVAGAGKDYSRGIVVKAGDDTGNSGAQAWDSQFWISFNQALPVGTKLHVEFDYAASQAAKGSTQAHGEPGAYQHWAAIGDVNFTTEWQRFSADIEVSGDMAGANGMKSVAFNLQEEKTATDYFFDNFGVWAELPEPVQEWADIVVNGDMEGADMVNFFATEQGVGGPFVATATEGIGKDGSKAVKVQSADSPANDWATQFFIRLPYQLPAGTKYKVSFDYKADKAGAFDTQAHAEPGQYIHWAFCGSGNFTTEWQTYTAEGTVPAECDGSSAQKTFQSIAFNLAKNGVATEFIFDNVKFEVPADVVETLVLNPYCAADAAEIEVPDGWTKAITNGNLAGDDVTSFVSKEYPSIDIVGARIVAGAGKDYSRGIVVKAGDDTGNSGAQAWDSQFWIQLNEKLTEGSKIHIEFDYKASKAAKASTQAHSNPGDYLHWAMMGDVNFTTEWQHFSADVDVTAAMAKGDNGNGSGDGLFSIAFNLQEEKSATDYYFDNFGVWYKLPIIDGINATTAEKNAEGIFNLNGQKVMKAQKGLYIKNGKKVVIK